MNDSVFLDTNIIIYAHTDHDIRKQKIAQSIINDTNTVISTQVLQETVNVLKKKLKQDYSDIIKVLADLTSNNQLYINTSDTITKACDIASKYGYSFFDSLIISAALETQAGILYSEDMQNAHLIENKIKIVNPFV